MFVLYCSIAQNSKQNDFSSAIQNEPESHIYEPDLFLTYSSQD